MAWGKKLLLSLSVFAIMLLKRLPDGSKMKSQNEEPQVLEGCQKVESSFSQA